MRSSTTTSRRVVGYAKRKPKRPPPRVPKGKPAPSRPNMAPPHEVRAAVKPKSGKWFETYGIPLILFALLGLGIAVTARMIDQRSPVAAISSSDPPASTKRSTQTAYPGSSQNQPASPAKQIARPMPTDESFIATYSGGVTGSTATASAAGAGNRANQAGTTPEVPGQPFHSTATGNCVVNGVAAKDIGNLLEGCLRRKD